MYSRPKSLFDAPTTCYVQSKEKNEDRFTNRESNSFDFVSSTRLALSLSILSLILFDAQRSGSRLQLFASGSHNTAAHNMINVKGPR
jgi:hypothetical protein